MWPVVRRPALRSYVSRLAPRAPASAGRLEPDAVRLILAVPETPALGWLRAGEPFAETAPQLSGAIPAQPTPPGPAPPSADEPRWADYDPPRQSARFLATLKDVLSGAAGARETAAWTKFTRDVETWKRERISANARSAVTGTASPITRRPSPIIGVSRWRSRWNSLGSGSASRSLAPTTSASARWTSRGHLKVCYTNSSNVIAPKVQESAGVSRRR